jgi:hypothetical protein
LQHPEERRRRVSGGSHRVTPNGASGNQQRRKRRALDLAMLGTKSMEPAYIKIIDGVACVASGIADEDTVLAKKQLALKAAMAGTWKYGTTVFQLDLTQEGALHFRKEVTQGSKKKSLSWALQSSGEWYGCDLVAVDGFCHGSVQFRILEGDNRMLLRCRASGEGEYNFEREARRMLA